MKELDFALHMLELFFEAGMQGRDLERLQEERLASSLKDAARTRHYRGALFGRDSSAICTKGLEDLPITEKEHVRSDPGSFIRDDLRKGALYQLRTSGSTGKPLALYIDREAASHRSAIILSTLMGYGLTPLDVFSQITTVRQFARPTMTLKWGLFRTLALDMFDADASNLRALRSHRVTRVSSVPSILERMAKANQEGAAPLSFKSIFCGGEVLYPEARKAIESSFSCRAFNIYSCWEFGTIAAECPQERSLHVKSGSVLLEIVDEKGRPKKSGVGEILVTGLRNRAMPLIRYRIGDLASWGKPCPCGMPGPVLKSLEGRSDDLITLPSGRAQSPLALNINHVPGVVSQIKSYRISQESEGLFTFTYVPAGKGVPQETLEAVRSQLRFSCFGEDIQIDFEEADEIRPDAGGKSRKVQSKVGHGRRVR